MHIAIDTNCILPGKVGGIENYTIALIEALRLPQSPATRLTLLTRPENHDRFSSFADERTRLALVARPEHRGSAVSNWADVLAAHPQSGEQALAAFQVKKIDLLRRLGVDLVHFPGNTVNPIDLPFPVVLNLHDLQHRHFPQYFSQAELTNREMWWRRSAERADALIAASQFVRNDLCEQWHIGSSRIFVTPDPMESSFLARPSEPALAELRQRLALPEVFFIYPAAVWPHKNHERLIRAFAAARTANAQLLLTGGGQAESSLPQLIESLGMSGRVRLLGRVETDDLVGLYHLASGLIFPSEHESWSIPVMEAMACGCPVASSNVTSLPEEIGEAGLLFAPDGVPAMTRAIEALAGDAALRRRLSNAGRQRCCAFTPNAFLAVLKQAYQHAASSFHMKVAALTMYDLSIVIPTCNRGSLLQRGLARIIETVQCDYEVIVVDGASSDSTPTVLAEAREPLGQRLRVFREKERRGFVKAANLGLRAAVGRNVTWLNDDARPQPGSLDLAVRTMDAADDRLALLAMFHRWHSPKNIAYEAFKDGQAYHLCHVRGTLYANFCIGRRATFERLNYFDERFYFYAADPDLSLKAWHAGMRVEPLFGAIVEHDEHEDDRRDADAARGREDNARLFAKWDLPEKNPVRNDFDPARPCTLRGLRTAA